MRVHAICRSVIDSCALPATPPIPSHLYTPSRARHQLSAEVVDASVRLRFRQRRLAQSSRGETSGICWFCSNSGPGRTWLDGCRHAWSTAAQGEYSNAPQTGGGSAVREGHHRNLSLGVFTDSPPGSTAVRDGSGADTDGGTDAVFGFSERRFLLVSLQTDRHSKHECISLLTYADLSMRTTTSYTAGTSSSRRFPPYMV